MKTCTKCRVEKEPSEFYLTRYGNPAAACKECVKVRSRAAAIANPEKVLTNQKRFHEAHPEKAAEYAKTWNSNPVNKLTIRASQNKWRRNNPDMRREAEARSRAKNPERYVAKSARYYIKHQSEVKTRVQIQAEKHPEKVAAAHALYYKGHPEKWAKRVPWRKKFPERHAAKQGKRRAQKVQATPAWANEFFIAEVYDLANRRTKALGFKWEVDHIVPLKSEVVCGLHVENNLRVISAAMNRNKSNRYWPDMPEVVSHI